jgi:c-di-GMP-binding flagellar brake protein YcgR
LEEGWALKEKLKIRQRVLLNIPEGQYPGNYYSIVENLISGEIIVVASPTIEDNSTLVNVGEKVNLFYWDSMAQYAFEAKVIDKKDGSRPTITLEKCSEEQRMQRRSFFRVQARLRVVFSIDREGAETEPREYEGQTLNVSGGGMLLATNIELEVGNSLPLKLYLTDKEYITSTGRVERIEYLGVKHLYRAGIVFCAIYENDRDKIIAYVFTKEIELRKKGLL